MAAPNTKRNSKREELIKAGIAEINLHGVSDFSIRRVGEACGLSSGAPYKHFGDRRGFIAAIIEYVNAQWFERQLQIIHEHRGNLREQLIWLSVGYVKFLVEKPHLRSIIMLKDDEFDNTYHKMRGEISSLTQRIVEKYCAQVNMNDETKQRKLYVIRALIFGAALMFDNGELEYNEDMLNVVRQSIEREFDLP